MEDRVEKEKYAGKSYELFTAYLSGTLQPLPWLNLGIDISLGDQIDYVHGNPADIIQLTPALNVNMGKHIRIKYKAG